MGLAARCAGAAAREGGRGPHASGLHRCVAARPSGGRLSLPGAGGPRRPLGLAARRALHAGDAPRGPRHAGLRGFRGPRRLGRGPGLGVVGCAGRGPAHARLRRADALLAAGPHGSGAGGPPGLAHLPAAAHGRCGARVLPAPPPRGVAGLPCDAAAGGPVRRVGRRLGEPARRCLRSGGAAVVCLRGLPPGEHRGPPGGPADSRR
mmetsp:Transcript_83079/g.268804  ORF Transcript_83079/g.268804 Transcript_83079/m.268804 type:complete len:206 (+) Transcript_83079:708-1325(+)